MYGGHGGKKVGIRGNLADMKHSGEVVFEA